MYPQQSSSSSVPTPYDMVYLDTEMYPGTGHSSTLPALNPNLYVQMDGHHIQAVEAPLLSDLHTGPQINNLGQLYPNRGQCALPYNYGLYIPSPCAPADPSHTFPAQSPDMSSVGYHAGPAMNGQMPNQRYDMQPIRPEYQNANGSPSLPMPILHYSNMAAESPLNPRQESRGHLNHDEPDACIRKEMERLGEGVKRRRHSMGLTQKDVGDCLGSRQNAVSLNQSTICRFEAGVLSSSNMQKLHLVISGWLDEMEKLDPEEVTKRVESKENYQRRKRTNINTSSRQYLEDFYIQHQRPNMQQIQKIAQALHLEPKVIRIWFTNRRQKHKTSSDAAVPASSSSHVAPPVTVSPGDFPGSRAPATQPTVNHPTANVTPYVNVFW